MNSSKKYLYVGVVALLLVIGVSLAYFGITIIGNDTAKNNKVVTGNLELTYTDTTEISLENAFPGDSFTKTISVKNTGTKEASYNLIWQELNNEITNDELVIEASCKRLNSSGAEEGVCGSISQTPIKSNTIKRNISIEPNITYEYTVKVSFIDTGALQDYNKNKSFTGKLGINEYKLTSPTPTYCTYNGELTQGAEYVNGQYTYRYMQEKAMDETTYDLTWQNMETMGWSVVLTDESSTDSVTSTLCTYINNKPVVSMAWMFAASSATSIDSSSFNTENVTNMHGMFASSQVVTFDLSNFDTSNVTDMVWMFWNSQITALDLSSFDTSKVTDMEGMFAANPATELDVSNFDTSNVTNMSLMFASSRATEISGLNMLDTSNVTNMNYMFQEIQAILDLSNFDTSNVTEMEGMFYGSLVKTLDVSTLNTSKVINMKSMFWGSQATTLDVSNFDTSNVTNMSEMFARCKVETLDISNFDTSKVTDMSMMFTQMWNIKNIYVSDKFKTDNVTLSDKMFSSSSTLIGGAGTTYDENHVDKEYARIDGGTSSPGYFTAK